jgi:hypothetical protein
MLAACAGAGALRLNPFKRKTLNMPLYRVQDDATETTGSRPCAFLLRSL